MTFVIDSSAMLAIIFDEPGADIAIEAARGALLSAVNLDEVLHKAKRRDLSPDVIENQLSRLGTTIQAFDVAQARVAAELHPRVFKRHISFGDRACMALAIVSLRSVLTAERSWPTLGLDIDIRLIR